MSVATSNSPLNLSQNLPPEKTLNELLNLALRSPEVGSVNFNILHTLLASMLQQLNLQNVLTQLPADDFNVASELPSDASLQVERLATKVSSLESKIDSLSDHSSAEAKATDTQSLSQKVADLERQYQALTAPPSNQELIERSKSGTSSATEIWQQMQLQKKVEANEGGVSRALSLIDDLMREMNRMREEQDRMRSEMKRMLEKLEQISDMSSILDRLAAVEGYKADIESLDSAVDELKSKLAKYPDASEFDTYITWPVLEEALTQHMAKMEELQRKKEEEFDVKPAPEPSPVPSRPASSRLSSAKERFPQATEMLERIGALNDLHLQLDGRVVVLEETMPTKQDKLDMDELLRKDTSVPDDLLEQLSKLREAVDALQLDKEEEDKMIAGLQRAVLDLQAELEKLQGLVQSAIDEHAVKQKHIDSLYEFVEKLEDVKADKEIVRMEIDVKADKRALTSKVNRTDFDSATGELNKGLDELIKKVITQDEEWQKTAKQLASDVDLKLDRKELEALKQSLENRLRAMKKLLDELRPGREGRAEDDAAGFRKQLIHNYHCISCDRAVELTPALPVPSIPANSALPAGRPVRPYTTYELEQLRQQTRGDGPDVDGVLPSGRPCGGSYTLTFPHRRYTRLNNLGELWPQEEEEIQEMGKEEVELQGHNGQIYRGRLPTISPPPERKRLHLVGGLQSGSSPRPSSARFGGRSKPVPRRPLSSTGVRRSHDLLQHDQVSLQLPTATEQSNVITG